MISNKVGHARSDQNWLVLSEEEMSGNIHTGGGGGYVAKEVADRLYQVVPQAHIVVFVRNQFEMIESAYRQYVSVGGTFSIKKYLFKSGGTNYRFPQFSFDHFEYDKLCKYYISRFGKDHVHVFLYEQMRQDPVAFFETFFATLQMPAIENIDPLATRRVHPSYSFVSICLARITNRFYGAHPINRRVIFHVPMLYQACKLFYGRIDRIRFIRRLDRKRPLVDSKIREYIEQRYAQSNAELGKLLDVDLGSYGYPC